MPTSGPAPRSDERALSTTHDHRDNHGQTPAAWSAVAVLLLGFLLGAVAVLLRTPWLFFVAIGVVVVGALTGKVMAMMGLGQAPGFHDGDNAGVSTHAEDVAQRSPDAGRSA